MNDNEKSSQDVEFDFNTPPAADSIVDQSMMKIRNIPDLGPLKAGAIGFLVFIVLGYYFFGSASHKETLLDRPDSIIATLGKMPSESVPLPAERTMNAPEDLDTSEPPLTVQPEEPVAIVPPAVAPESVIVIAPEPTQAPSSQAEPLSPPRASSSSSDAAPVVVVQNDSNNAKQWAAQQEALETFIVQQSEIAQMKVSSAMKTYHASTLQQFQRLAKEQEVLAQSVKQIVDNLSVNAAQLKTIEHFIQAEIQEFAQPMGIVPAPVAPKYVVHAMIPGRAWIRDPQQKIMSITIGQTVEGYGTVLTIDPKLGTVILSSGQVLRY